MSLVDQVLLLVYDIDFFVCWQVGYDLVLDGLIVWVIGVMGGVEFICVLVGVLDDVLVDLVFVVLCFVLFGDEEIVIIIVICGVVFDFDVIYVVCCVMMIEIVIVYEVQFVGLYDVMVIEIYYFDVKGVGCCSLWLVCFVYLLCFDGGDWVQYFFVSVDNMIECQGVFE